MNLNEVHGTQQTLNCQILCLTELNSFVLVTGSVTLYQLTPLVLLMLNSLQGPAQERQALHYSGP